MGLTDGRSIFRIYQQSTCSKLSFPLLTLPFMSKCGKQYPSQSVMLQPIRRGIHTTAFLGKWEMKNQRVYPPQKPGEPRRPAEMFYCKKDIKHSKKKMWYAASFVRGMMIDDAITQLRYVNKKAAQIVREILMEAREEAVMKHNFEYRSDMHIAASFATRARSEHAVRYHAKGRSSMLDLVYCHYFVCLREGPPSEERVYTGYDQAEDYVKLLRKRQIPVSL